MVTANIAHVEKHGSRWRIIWNDKSATSGATATELLNKLAASPWNQSAPIKDLLSDRAWAAHRAAIDPLLPDEDFLIALAKAGAIKLHKP